MAEVTVVDDRTVRIKLALEDAVAMIEEASCNTAAYAEEIIRIYEKMPEFEYTHFCFYAYDTAKLFEKLLPVDPKRFNAFRLEAPDAFFYALYGGMAGLVPECTRSSKEVCK